jgi:hypothetical protein
VTVRLFLPGQQQGTNQTQEWSTTTTPSRKISQDKMVSLAQYLLESWLIQSGYQNGYGHQHLEANTDSDLALRHIRTAGSISISPELFEKLYLSPQNKVKGELRKTFGNPTPL